MTANNKTIPTIDLVGTAHERRIEDSIILTEGARLYLDNGCLLVKNVFDPELIQQLYNEYSEEYKGYFKDDIFSDALSVGDKRTQITVEVKGSFNNPEFYANPAIYPLLEYLLGIDFILGSLGSVVSLPGSEIQHIHRDHPNIYHTPDYYSGSQSILSSSPPYAITVVIPLVPINEVTGNTRVWLGSHLNTVPANTVLEENGVDFVAELGTCLFVDYRLIHRGMPNKSESIRPIIYSVYYRPWFQDYRNYRKHNPLVMKDDAYTQVPGSYRRLFSGRRPE